MRGFTRPIEFEAMVVQSQGEWLVQTQQNIDRTRFGSIYGSGRFFEALGKHLVNDHISLEIQLFAALCRPARRK